MATAPARSASRHDGGLLASLPEETRRRIDREVARSRSSPSLSPVPRAVRMTRSSSSNIRPASSGSLRTTSSGSLRATRSGSPRAEGSPRKSLKWILINSAGLCCFNAGLSDNRQCELNKDNF